MNWFRSFLVDQENGANAENGSVNITDEEKEQLKCNSNSDDGQSSESNRPFLDTVLYVPIACASPAKQKLLLKINQNL